LLLGGRCCRCWGLGRRLLLQQKQQQHHHHYQACQTLGMACYLCCPSCLAPGGFPDDHVISQGIAQSFATQPLYSSHLLGSCLIPLCFIDCINR
jgi:hypothetical protein